MQDRLTATGLLAAWEAGANRQPLDRALAILWAAGAGGDDPADLPLAERDRRLLSVRRHTFGPILPARATCHECGAEMETEIDTRLLVEALPEPGEDDLRPITSRDLAAVADLPADEISAALCARLAPGVEASEALGARIEAEAEAAELRTAITCAECGARWTETLDVAAHVWAGVEHAALVLLTEVAELAARYGWPEPDILALSPARRRAYLTLARSG
ncbi:MAG: hypothetical protein AB3N21_03745 [Ruegeria sp.]|uniref:hypothetical protein n=1 Tax=Ruegeria sp. TaxID=1879320 RepID=UPI00349E6D2C